MIYIPKQIRNFLLISFLIVALHLGLFTSSVQAFEVDELPEDNLIVNPWFRSPSDSRKVGLDGWTRVLTDGVGWGLSQKESNPSPDIVITGRCGFREVYCGTAARWANQMGNLYPDLDVYLYQVVQADSSHRKLKFFTHWVTHRVDVAEVVIYGGSSPEGPWTEVWVPMHHEQDDNPGRPPGGAEELWEQTGFVETILEKGFDYYKVEIHGRYPEAKTEQGDVGFKITGLYFSTESSTEPATIFQPETPTPIAVTPTDTRKSRTSRDGEITATPTPVIDASDTPGAISEIDEIASATTSPEEAASTIESSSIEQPTAIQPATDSDPNPRSSNGMFLMVGFISGLGLAVIGVFAHVIIGRHLRK